jgi:hypothetical protein
MIMDFNDMFSDSDLTPDEIKKAKLILRDEITYDSLAMITGDIQELFMKSMKTAKCVAALSSDPEIFQAFNQLNSRVMEDLAELIILDDTNRN